MYVCECVCVCVFGCVCTRVYMCVHACVRAYEQTCCASIYRSVILCIIVRIYIPVWERFLQLAKRTAGETRIVPAQHRTSLIHPQESRTIDFERRLVRRGCTHSLSDVRSRITWSAWLTTTAASNTWHRSRGALPSASAWQQTWWTGLQRLFYSLHSSWGTLWGCKGDYNPVHILWLDTSDNSSHYKPTGEKQSKYTARGRTHVHTHTHTHTHIHVNIVSHTHTHTYSHTHTHTHTCTHTHTHTHTHTQSLTHTHTCACACIHTHTCVHTHTHMCACIRAWARMHAMAYTCLTHTLHTLCDTHLCVCMRACVCMCVYKETTVKQLQTNPIDWSPVKLGLQLHHAVCISTDFCAKYGAIFIPVLLMKGTLGCARHTQ